MEFVNLTKHDINIILDSGEKITIPPSGTEARVLTEMEDAGSIGNIPIVKSKFGGIVGLPEPKEGTIYIVSLQVLQELRGSRPDVVGPNTSPSGVIRDAEGRIIGAKGFQIV